jgi:hypothetical protein
MIGICNVVFGGPFVELWNSICLPTELSPSNVKALNSAGKARYIVYTNRRSLSLIEDCIVRRRLRDYFDVDVHVMNMDALASSHTGMTLCHQHCITNYKSVVDGVIFSSADDCYHENYYQSVYDQAISKNKSCITFALRVSLGCFKEMVEEIEEKPEIGYRSAVRFQHQFLHPIHQDQILQGNNLRSKHPAVLFEYSEDVLTMRGFHMHPMYVRSDYLSTAFNDTIDGEFVESIGRFEDSYTLMSGLNAPFVLSLTPQAKYSDLRSDRTLGMKYILRWISKHTNCAHKDFFRKHSLVTSLRDDVAPENMEQYSPQLVALKGVMEKMTISDTKHLGTARYIQPLRKEVRRLAWSWMLSYFLQKLNIRWGLFKPRPAE